MDSSESVQGLTLFVNAHKQNAYISVLIGLFGKRRYNKIVALNFIIINITNSSTKYNSSSWSEIWTALNVSSQFDPKCTSR